MLINKSDENYGYKKIYSSIFYFVSPSVYFCILNAKAIYKIVSKTYRQMNYHRDRQNSKDIIVFEHM